MCLKDEERITVGSSAYNLAGEVVNRANFLKNTVLSLIFSGASKNGLGAGIVNTHFAGPAATYNRFFKWAEVSGYNAQVGNSAGLVYNSGALTPEGFSYLVPTKSTHDQRAVSFTTSTPDLNLIAFEWIIKNSPDKRGTTYTATLEKSVILLGTFTGKVLITYFGGATETFTPDYDLNSLAPMVYLYHEERPKVLTEVDDTGWLIQTPPDRTGFVGSPINDVQSIVENVITTEVITYSNSAPSSTTVSSSPQNLSFTKTVGAYTKVETVIASFYTVGKETTTVQNEESFYTVLFNTTTTSSSYVNAQNVTVTTTITVETPYIETYWKYRKVTTVISQPKWLPFLLKLYQKGTDAVGDSLLFIPPTPTEKFFPIIPLRRDNVMVDKEHFLTQYNWNRKASKKCFGAKKKYDSLIKSLADNPSLDQIDHAWVVFGVSLSTQQQDGFKYLYAFFKNLADMTVSVVGAHKNPLVYETAWAEYMAALEISTNDEHGFTPRPIAPSAQTYTLIINSSSGVRNWLYDIAITCKGGSQTVGNGYHQKSGRRLNQCWVYAKGEITITVPKYIKNVGDIDESVEYEPVTSTIITFGKQVTPDIWVEYDFYDLVHVNNVYEGVSVTTLGATVIASLKEDSSFILPLHKNVFKELSLIRRTQLSLECSFIVVNYYDKQTIPWYSTGFFQIITVVAIVVIAVYTGYISADSIGLLGANAVVGASLGFAGIAATIAGFIANALAAAIVAALVTKVAISLLGEDVGRIIGVLASMIAINMMTPGGSFSFGDAWAQLTKADNLIKLTLSGVSQYGSKLQNQAMEVYGKTQSFMEETNKVLETIHKLTQELIGGSGINPTTFSDAIRYVSESPTQFLDRTTMTGTEIAEISLKLVEDFPAPQLKLPYQD